MTQPRLDQVLINRKKSTYHIEDNIVPGDNEVKIEINKNTDK